ncbi:MAG: hypothetical protein LBK53_06480 [Heliobacteriaceae bacterium]|jgi:hypothetical protein|nr:hypothetical protein [Heliobacteriaceae bacterium]
MNEQLLRTCKRLNRFTLEELEIITETDKSLLKPVLEEFISQRQLVLRDGIYFYCNKKSTEKALLKLPLSFQYHSPKVIEIIIRSFCADIPSTKTALLTDLGLSCITKFYKFFRKLLYEKQQEELLISYRNNPQKPSTRVFFDVPFSFYTYNKKIFVTIKPFPKKKNPHSVTEEDYSEFKRVYSFVTRGRESHKFQVNMEHRIAELIWRRNKPFEQLFTELKALLNT